MAHRRLSIIDLSAGGHQPMHVEGLTLTYNGEIYNYLELRQELESLGQRFTSDCDSDQISVRRKFTSARAVNWRRRRSARSAPGWWKTRALWLS